MTAPHVAFVYRDATRRAGGLSIDIRNLANHVVDHGGRASVIGIGASGSDGLPGFQPRVDVVALKGAGPSTMSVAYGTARGTSRTMRGLDPDVVHVFSCLPVYLHFAAMSAARRQGRVLVWTPMIHPLRGGLWDAYGLAGRAMRVFDAAVPRLGRHVDAVVAATGEEAERFRDLGCSRVEVLPPAVSGGPPQADGDARAVRERYGLGSAPLVLAVTGRAEKRKGIEYCLRSFELLRQRLADAVLVVVGSGLPDPSPTGMTVLSGLSDDELRSLYRAAGVVFVPSRYEAFSRVVIEAWEQARPVVVTDGVGLAAKVKEGAGLVVPFGDGDAAAEALQRLLGDPDLGDQLGKVGRAMVESEFAVPVVAARNLALYAQLARG